MLTATLFILLHFSQNPPLESPLVLQWMFALCVIDQMFFGLYFSMGGTAKEGAKPLLFSSLVPRLVKYYSTLPCCSCYAFYFVKMPRGLWVFRAKKISLLVSFHFLSHTPPGQPPSFKCGFPPSSSPNKVKSEEKK